MKLDEVAMLSAATHLQLQIMKTEKPAREKKSIWKKSWLQRRVFYGHYEELVAELRGEDMKKLHCFAKFKRKIKTGQNRSQIFISAGVTGHVVPRMNRTPRNTTVPFP